MSDALDWMNGVVMLLGALTSLGLAAAVLVQRRRGFAQWTLGVGMLLFAVEAVVIHALVTTTEAPEQRTLWLRAMLVSGLLVPLPWAAFGASVSYSSLAAWPRGWQVGIVAGGAATIGLAVAAAMLPAFQVSDIPGPFYAAQLDVVARYAVVVQMLWTVAVLTSLEARMRTSKGASRWRIKYLLLGLGGIFLVRFFFLSQVLLFHVVMASYLVSAAATLTIGNLVIAASLVRDRFLESERIVSRQAVYRSVVVGVLGLYLALVGALGWLLNHLGIPEEVFWGSTVVFISAIALAAVLLSETVRWRMKRFIGQHFYRSKYDYRREWTSFTSRLGSLLTVDELSPQLLGAVCDSVGTTSGALYLLDDRRGEYQLVAAREVAAPPTLPAASVPLLAGPASAHEPVVLRGAPRDGAPDPGSVVLAEWFPEGSTFVALPWRGIVTGVMVVGPERTGAPYGVEDLEYLATVGEQAAGALANARLSEEIASAREFEAFHRLTSFIVHDLKNSISALSMLSQNALAHVDDPEFQRDAVKTVSRTVTRMKALLGRLAATPESASLQNHPIDLCALAGEALGPLKGNSRIQITAELSPMPVLTGDAEGLLRVLQNLIGNAVEALDGQGEVSVKTYVEGPWAVMAVSDSGAGMAEEFMRKSLFLPFKSTKKAGWGIGLWQAKSIVESHKGSIEVESRLGEGTTFRVRLPLPPDRAEDGGR